MIPLISNVRPKNIIPTGIIMNVNLNLVMPKYNIATKIVDNPRTIVPAIIFTFRFFSDKNPVQQLSTICEPGYH